MKGGRVNSAEARNDDVVAGVAKVLLKSVSGPPNTPEIRPETSLIDDLDLDSPTMIDVMLDLENHFQVEISDGEMWSASTVKDVEVLILRKLQERPQSQE